MFSYFLFGCLYQFLFILFLYTSDFFSSYSLFFLDPKVIFTVVLLSHSLSVSQYIIHIPISYYFLLFFVFLYFLPNTVSLSRSHSFPYIFVSNYLSLSFFDILCSFSNMFLCYFRVIITLLFTFISLSNLLSLAFHISHFLPTSVSILNSFSFLICIYSFL